MLNKNQSSIVDNTPAEADLSIYDIEHRFGRDTGVSSTLLQNNALFNLMKQDEWSYSDWSTPVTKITHGRKDGKFYQTEEQYNTEAIAARCARYRAASEAGHPDPLAPPMPDGKPGYRWMNLPKVVARQIQNDYFGGAPWEVIKMDKVTKAQFYQIVERDYNQYVCFPGGKLPLPIRPRIPSKKGGDKTIFKNNWAGDK